MVEASPLPSDDILEGDCRAAMARLPSGSIDLVFADPPYNLQLSGELHRPDNSRVDGVEEAWDKFAGFAEYDGFTRGWLAECRRLLKPDGRVFLEIGAGQGRAVSAILGTKTLGLAVDLAGISRCVIGRKS